MRTIVVALIAVSALAPASFAQHAGYPEVTPLPPVYRSAAAYAVETLLTELPLPVSLVPLGDGTDRLLLVSLAGRVLLIEAGAVRPEPFLDLAGRVTAREGEQGLFSVALEPLARATARGGPRRLVAAFTEAGSGDLLVAAYPLAPDLGGADAAGERVLLRLPIPEPFHHGGQVAFGPDGVLYVSVGSGERAVAALHAPVPTPQDLTSLRGKVLRVDPFAVDGEPYTVPPDNPFTASSHPAAAAAGARPEIWAYGFRNPWKFSFGPRGELYLADVGMDRWEEIDLVVRGGNYGWPAREAAECVFFPDAAGLIDPACPQLDLIDPVVRYAHLALDPEGGQSVTGGVVVNDPDLPELSGRYLYGDFVSGRLWSYDPATERVELLLRSALPLSGIATGAKGEVLLLGIDGTLARLVPLP